MFWILIGIMLTAAVLIVAVPLYRAEKRLSITSILSIIAVTVVSAGTYSQIGTPNSSPGAANMHEGGLPGLDQMVTSLATRLQENPDDLAGWRMLGRTYFELKNLPGAEAAFAKAVDLESGQNSQTLADLGEVVLYQDQRSLLGRAGQLFESALAIAPNNPKALFYGGMAAVERGDKDLAANRWESLLATSPPPNVQEILRQQIADLRGTDLPPPVEVPAGGDINVDIMLGDAAAAASAPDAIVFIIARDPAQPSPPIAAVRRQVSDLPASIRLSDSDAMIAGRVPSGFEQLEIVVRVSANGQPVAASGDWFGQQIIETAGSGSAHITIDQQVP